MCTLSTDYIPSLLHLSLTRNEKCSQLGVDLCSSLKLTGFLSQLGEEKANCQALKSVVKLIESISTKYVQERQIGCQRNIFYVVCRLHLQR